MENIFETLTNTGHTAPISEGELTDEKVLSELFSIRKRLGNRVTVLGHHYQQDDVIALADITGDSLELAKHAAKLPQETEFVIFCGVHFMAETADMLTKGEKKIILPDLRAGCSMADMANRIDIDRAWNFLTSHSDGKITPITYINCAATLKSFVGENGGAICTSSNAEKVITWGLNQGEKLLFFPDQHLGRNTCFKLGIPLSDMVVYDPRKQNGGLTPDEVKSAKIILWYGYCSVHQGFNLDQIKNLRKNEPDRTIIVHPECSFDVVQNADLAGSTSFIINHIQNAPAGAKFAVGTEINLVNRLNQKFSDKDVQSLSPYQCLCTTMYRIRPRWMLESFRAIENGQPINVISVDAETRKWSLKALERMLEII